MLSVEGARFPEVVSLYPRQIELEQTISDVVHKHQGLKETDLWLMVMAAMTKIAGDGPPLAIVAGTVQRMLNRGKLVGIDYVIADHGNTFVLPPKTTTMVRVPQRVTESTISVLHPIR